jgi:hypothetical protein
MGRYIEMSIYRFRYRYIVSYRIGVKNIDFSIYRDIFYGLIIAINTSTFAPNV